MQKPPFTEFDIFQYPNCIYSRDYFLDYQIQNVNSNVGVGVHGKVYLGLCLETQEKVVIKFMKPYYKTAKSLELHKSRLSHPQVADLKNYYLNYLRRPNTVIQESPRYWLISVQEYIPGHDLYTELIEKRNNSPNPTPELYRERELFIKEVSQQLIQIIKDLEDIGLVHSDVKTENIIYTPETQQITLIDTDYLAEINHTRFCGTYEYFSWEMVRNGLNRARNEEEKKQYKITGTSDLWSIGVLIYVAILHKFPFGINRPDQKKPNFRNVITFKYTIPSVLSRELKDFLHRIFVRQKLRISLKDALDHPWLNSTKSLDDLPPPPIPANRA